METNHSQNVRNKKEMFVQIVDLKKWFPIRSGLLRALRGEKLYLKAVDGIDFSIRKEEIFGIVGESGCGKTTTGRLLVGLTKPTHGNIYYHGSDISSLENRFQYVQMIFQEPYEYLSPWSSVKDSLLAPLNINRILNDREQRLDRVKALMETTGLTPVDEFLPKYPGELSGGQRQRVMIARAFILNPTFIVADEPVSMLDASIRAGILDLMLNLRKKYHSSFLYITHDLAIARYMCDRIAVMYLGKIMEAGSADDVIDRPCHPYSKALIAAVPVTDPEKRDIDVPIKGEIQTAASLPTGCRFHPRCPYARDICRKEEPELAEVSRGHLVRCI